MLKPKHAVLIFSLTLSLFACIPTPSSTATPNPSLSHLPSATTAPAPTSTSAPRSTTSSTSTPLPPPPKPLNLRLWYLQAGKIYRYNFLTWEAEEIPIESQGLIKHAKSSEDMQVIAYIDAKGLKIAYTRDKTIRIQVSFVDSMDQRDFLLTSDGSLLAYSDEEALKIFDLSTGITRILIEHNRVDLYTDDFDAADYRAYTPAQWSPEYDWLVVEERYYEGNSYKFISSYSGKLLLSSACRSQFSSLPDNQALVFSVAFRGYGFYPCGQEGGIYIAKFDGVVTEAQLYEDHDDGELISSQIVHISSSPNGEWVAFTEYVSVNSARIWRFMLGILPMGGGEFFSQYSDDDIAYLYPTWSTDSKHLYFVESDQNQSTIYSLSIISKYISVIGSFMGEICLFTSTPNSDWFLISFRRDKGSGCELGLIDIHSGEIYPFQLPNNISILGWENTD